MTHPRFEAFLPAKRWSFYPTLTAKKGVKVVGNHYRTAKMYINLVLSNLRKIGHPEEALFVGNRYDFGVLASTGEFQANKSNRLKDLILRYLDTSKD
jgi:hypothetical protein